MSRPHVLLFVSPLTIRTDRAEYSAGDVAPVLRLRCWDDAAPDILLENGDVFKEKDLSGSRIAVLLDRETYESIRDALRRQP